MSVVVVTKSLGEHLMVADSAMSTMSFVNVNAGVKLHTIGDDFAFGFCGNPEILTMFKSYLHEHPVDNPETFDESRAYIYMAGFYEFIETRGFSVMDKDDPETFEVAIMTPWRILIVQRYFVHEVDEFFAIGAGNEIALSALHLGQSAEDAARLACELNPWCSLPLVTRSIGRIPNHGDENNR